MAFHLVHSGKALVEEDALVLSKGQWEREQYFTQ